MADKQPSFAERCRAMHDVDEQLKRAAEVVALEAIRMAAAERCFSERRSTSKPGR
jgi:hypothetical protein